MVESNSESKRGAPAYVAYQTLTNFIGLFKEHGLPNRIDRSVLKSFSGGVQNQLMAALKFLNLMQDDGKPTDALHNLRKSIGTAAWKEELAKVLQAAYPDLFKMQLATASPSEFVTGFKDAYPAEGDTLRKAMTFFLNAARDADVPVSPFILKNKKPRGPATPNKRKPRVAAKNGDGTPAPTPRMNEEDTPAPSITTQLLDKFPDFDPSWPDPIKAKWFEGYERLLSMGERK